MNNLLKCVLMIFTFLYFSCGEDENDLQNKFIKDDYGNIFSTDSLPKRIISLAPNLTECLYAIGADSLLVGVTNYCDYPPQAKTKTKIGGILDPNYEIMTSLKPDVILLTTEGNPKNIYFSLKNYNFKVFVTNPGDINGVSNTILNLGKLTGKFKTAEDISNIILAKKRVFELMNKDIVRKKCLLLISLSPFITVNKFTYINEIIELSGLDNLYKDEINSYPMINYESVIEKNPDYLLISVDTGNTNLINDYKQKLNTELNATNAVKNNKIFFIDENLLSRPGPRVIECIDKIRKYLSG